MTVPRAIVVAVALAAAASASARPVAVGTASATALRCNYMVNPLGVEDVRPLLSWQMKDARRGARQTAYRILVASSPRVLAANRGDLWDTGRVPSNRSLNLEYRGKALRPRQGCWWAVRIWDHQYRPSAWSQPARWETGIGRHGWRARWIGGPAQGDTPDLSAVRWIWHADSTQGVAAPAGERYFRASVTIPAGFTIEAASLLVAVDNSFRAYCNGKQVGSGSGWKGFATVPLDRVLAPGRNTIAIAATNDTDGPAGLAALLTARLRGGATVTFPTDGAWRSSAQRFSGWNDKVFYDSTWTNARVIGAVGIEPWGVPSAQSEATQCSMMRKEFAVPKAVTRARLYVSALGSYRMSINGTRVGSDWLTPDWTDYRRRASYQIYDVTSLVRPGANAIGAILGDGWYGSGLGWGLQRFSMGSAPTRLIAELHVTHADGTETVLATDRTWKAAPSPILLSQIYAGETYDARLEQTGWDRAGFNERAWKPVSTPTTPRIEMTAQCSPTIRVTGNIRPISAKRLPHGITVYDMGQNMPGWLRIKVRGARGAEVVLRSAERLNDDGTIYTENLRRAADTDRYILRGGAPEVFEPHFTYRGFRYVQLTTTSPAPKILEVTGRVAHTAVPISAAFATGSDLVNRIQHNIVWGIRGNLHSVPTDCPQRDERLGWMGDAGVIWRTACYQMDMAAFTRKWMRDVVEAQSPAGGFPDVAPRVVDAADGAPAWGDAGVILPWVAFRQYGDAELVRRCWPAMERWMDYIHSENPELLWLRRRNNDFGDWVPANSSTPKDVIASAYWANDARMMSAMARGIGRDADAERYARLFDGIRAAFAKRYIQADGTVGNGSQTCQALALHYNLTPDELRPAVAAKLVDDVRGRGWHLSTGFVGTSPLMNALTETGHHDVATRLLLNKTYPSWGYMVAKGATTMWERWNGDTGDPGMNSFNHYAYGCVGEWMFACAAGIDTDPATPGYARITIRPHVDPQLPTGRVTYQSVRGPITVAWRLAAGKLALDVAVPANTTATVYVPATNPSGIREGGRPAASSPGVRAMAPEQGCGVFAVGGGTYRFTAR